MPNRRAALPRGIWWTIGGIAAVVLALAIAWALFVPTADWLAHHDVGSVTGSLHETALDNARGRLLTLGAGLFAAGALVFTARNFTVSRRTLELTEQGQVTDRFTKAIEQLGSDKIDVRIGGIYALERVARDSARDHPTVMEVFTAFIREHSREQWPPPDDPARRGQERSTRPDVQAALTVLGRREPRFIRSVDLSGADLTGADLTGANFFNAFFTGADLTRAQLARADLTHAYLSGANLSGANVSSADLTYAYLSGANLSGADLQSAILARADFTRANLSGANLSGADLTRAHLREADLTGADLHRRDRTVTGANLTGAYLFGARWPEGAPVPEGWELDVGSGRLRRAGTDAEPAESNQAGTRRPGEGCGP